MPNYHGFDHITLWTSNALQAALYYTARHGFSHIAYRGLETGDRDLVSHVLRQGNVTFLIQSPLHANAAGGRVAEFVSTHGDAVKDVAFEVDDVRTIYEVIIRLHS
jgi:4-hydroxyphenylpyruvate dioxygenase